MQLPMIRVSDPVQFLCQMQVPNSFSIIGESLRPFFAVLIVGKLSMEAPVVGAVIPNVVLMVMTNDVRLSTAPTYITLDQSNTIPSGSAITGVKVG